ncbi:type I restriction-modification system, S subunit [Mycoplasma haemocanis str. Illinois]|uniref:Type I restriction-modification system, S subunit n=1 Tax=Mycoplasma haemocanis (strain Illinois) TaxID=1111676 RepID=H6N6Z4_MYCHN|nr:hypothetical protein [Mycoplasma haemocanis]AEW45416.1 type I restriction-modification system, S subunit [Mycoplasma haemocanis str. Illinois]
MNQGVWRLDPKLRFLDQKYLFHFLPGLNFDLMMVKGIILCLSVNRLRQLNISVQQAIVFKLNKFLELKKELILRKKQHKFLSEKVFEFYSSVVA